MLGNTKAEEQPVSFGGPRTPPAPLPRHTQENTETRVFQIEVDVLPLK